MTASIPDFDAARVYAQDKRTAEVCRDMSVNGFRIDRKRATELSAALLDEETRLTASIRALTNSPKLNPFSTRQIAHAFAHELGAPVWFRSSLTGAPSMGVDAMRAYAACRSPQLRDAALAVLALRRARKVRKTYIDNVATDDHGRVHPSWLTYGAVSGRLSCQGPNLMNLPRPENDPTTAMGGIRSLYVASPGCTLVAWDCKQLEMRIAAYASGDDAMIRACESSDIHSANAEVAFGDGFRNADASQRKALRTLAKSAGFAVCYMAETKTVYARIVASGITDIKIGSVDAMLTRMRRAFALYYDWQARALLDIVREGYVYSPMLRRRRWLGHEPSPTEAANFPIQSGAADHMNERLTRIAPLLPRGCRIVAQVHDSIVIDCPRKHVDSVKQLAHDVFEAPSAIATSGRVLRPSFPIDLEESERWH